VFSFGACKKEIPVDLSSTSNETTINAASEQVANTLSFALEDQEVKDFVIQHCFEKENGDYEFLYAFAKDKYLSSGISLKEKLAQLDPSRGLSYYDKGVLEASPLLTFYLYFPVQYTKEQIVNIKSYSRVYASTEKDDQNMEELIPFYVKGVRETVKLGITPTEPMLVIGQNERFVVNLSEDKATFAGKVHGINYYKIFSGEAIPFTEEVDPFQGVQDRTCQRDIYSNKYDNVPRVKFANTYDPWYDGGPELRITCIMVNNEKIENIYELAKSDINQWELINCETIIWFYDLPRIGNRIKYHFSEQDSGGTPNSQFTTTVTSEIKDSNGNLVTSTSTGVTFGGTNDDFVGEAYEYYCNWVHPTSWGNEHNAGPKLAFWTNVKP
jgi:hypothetical protein